MFALNLQFFPIGIDISSDAVRMVQLRRHPMGGLTVGAAGRRSIALGDNADTPAKLQAAADAIASVLSMGEFNGKRVVVSLPPEMIHTRTVRLAAAPDSDAIPAELKAAFDIDLSNATVRLIRAGSVRHSLPEGEEVIAMAAGNDDLNELTQRLHDRGVRPLSMEVRVLSLHRAARRCGEESPTTALLELDGDWARLLIARGADVSFLKNIPVGVAELSRSLARTLSISVEEARELRRRTLNTNTSPADDGNDPVRRAVADAGRAQMELLASEVGRCLRYHAVTFRGRQPNVLIVCGNEAHDSQSHGLLTTRTGLPVMLLDPFQNIDTSVMRSADRSGNRSEWAVAVGLALKKIDRQLSRNAGGSSPLPSPGTPREGQGGGHAVRGRPRPNRHLAATLPPPQPSPGVPGEGENSPVASLQAPLAAEVPVG
jgi:type IV pilus assembly protein PilM